MWDSIETQTKTKWFVESRLRDIHEWGLLREDYEWMGPEARAFEFWCKRVDGEVSIERAKGGDVDVVSKPKI